MTPLEWMAVAAVTSAVAGVGSTVYNVANRPKKPDTPLPNDKSASEAAYAEYEQARKRKAAGTLVTGAMGVGGEVPTTKTLLGG